MHDPIIPFSRPHWLHAPAASAAARPDSAQADSLETVDYGDPAASGVVPLVNVAGRRSDTLSEHFRIEDFAAQDGASYARISDDLIDALEQLHAQIRGPIGITSAYRHPALNAQVGGASQSQHMAGRAADIWSDALMPLDFAAAVLEVIGCRIGIGLGQNFIHIDVRGQLATWAEADAVMSEQAFDRWVRNRCSDLGFVTEADSAAAASSESSRPLPAEAVVAEHRGEMANFARAMHRRQGRGAVVVDLRRDEGRGPHLSYVVMGSRASKRMGIESLVRHYAPERYFVFLVITPTGTRTPGLMSYRTGRQSPDDSEETPRPQEFR